MIALLAATAALLGGAAALGAASAAAEVNQNTDCMSLSWVDWISCLAEKAGGGSAGSGEGGAGGGADPTDVAPPYNGIDPATGAPWTIDSEYELEREKLRDRPDLLDALVARELRERDIRCRRVMRIEKADREEMLQFEGGPGRRLWMRRLTLLRSQWNYFECDDLWSSSD